MSEELALFAPEEVKQVPVKIPEDVWGAETVKWTRCSKTAHPSVCTYCIDAAREQGVAPQPLRAVWRRRGPNGEVHLCHAHTQHQRELDARAGALAKARRDINDRTATPSRKRREGSS